VVELELLEHGHVETAVNELGVDVPGERRVDAKLALELGVESLAPRADSATPTANTGSVSQNML